MRKKLDAEQVREKLQLFLDKNYRVSPRVWAARMGLSYIAFMKFINKVTKPHRKTIGIIDTFITDVEGSVKRIDPTQCEVCGLDEIETYYVDRGDGEPHWMCFDHMKG